MGRSNAFNDITSHNDVQQKVSTVNLSMQMDDILLLIFKQLSLSDIQRMRLVNKRLSALADSKMVWINLLRQLDLPLPPESFPLSARTQQELMQLATRSVRLDANWRQPRPAPSSMRTVPVDAVVMCMTMCSGLLFTANKDGLVRCWQDLGPQDGSGGQLATGSNGREDFSRSVLCVPPIRIIKFSHLEACIDPTRGGFILAYVGDGIDRRTYCGVFHVPSPVDGRYRSNPTPLGHFEETKGIVSLAISPTTVALGKSTEDSVSVIDLTEGEKYTVQVPPQRCEMGTKIMRAHILSTRHLLVLTSSLVSIYPIPGRDTPASSTPLFQTGIPSCASLSIGRSFASPSGVNSTVLYGVTEDGFVVKYTLSTQTPLNAAMSRLAAEGDTSVFTLQGGARERFPYSVERLSVTEVVGGSKKAVWIHWRRGAEGWPVHLMGSSEESPVADMPNHHLPTSRPLRCLSMFRPLDSTSSPPSTSPSAPLPAEISEFIKYCTRGYTSMPRICFDEGIGRLVIAGMSANKIAVYEYA